MLHELSTEWTERLENIMEQWFYFFVYVCTSTFVTTVTVMKIINNVWMTRWYSEPYSRYKSKLLGLAKEDCPCLDSL